MQELTDFNNSTLKKLNTNCLARKYVYYDKIDSTQKEIWRQIAENKVIDGILVRANTQTAGIGTHGRVWYTTKNNIAFSFYLELECDIQKIQDLTTRIAEIIVEIMKNSYNVNLDIKLPNDLYANGKKIGGILTEAKTNGNIVKYIVVGIGINNSEVSFNNQINNIASSIYKEFGIEVDVEDFITEFCNMFEKEVYKRIGENK